MRSRGKRLVSQGFPGRRRGGKAAIWLRAITSLLLINAAYFIIPLRRADLFDEWSVVRGFVILVDFSFLTWLVMRQVHVATQARFLGEQISILVIVVNVVIVFFAITYMMMRDQFDGIDTRLDSLYFAMTTLATVGYGDIVATGQPARVIVIVQMVFDLIVLTSAISIVLGNLKLPRESRDSPRRNSDTSTNE